MKAKVIAVSLSPTHTFSKQNVDSINLLKGLGVEGDAHCGKMVKHRSRVKLKPLPVNLRQVHLIHAELFDELAQKGFQVAPGNIGENITTRGIALLDLPKGALLKIGKTAVVEVTGLRNPCTQLNVFQEGLMQAVLDRDENGGLIRKSGIMGIVLEGGEVFTGDEIDVELPKGEFVRLERV